MLIDIEGRNVHFQAYGQGPALLVLHGWGDSGSAWMQVAQLLQHSFQVFLLDLPGFGYSDPPPSVWGVEEYERLIERFIEELEIENPTLLGHSHGGKIASWYASLRRPCRRLILVSSSGLDRKSLKVRLKVAGFKFAKHALAFCGSWGRKKLDELRSKLGSQDYRDAGELRATMVKVVNQKLFTIVPKIDVPTLILWGSEDATLDMKQAKVFRRLIRNSRIRILWGSSHHPHLDAPADLAERVIEFCTE